MELKPVFLIKKIYCWNENTHDATLKKYIICIKMDILMILKIQKRVFCLYIPTNQTLLKLQPQNKIGKLDNTPLRALPSLMLKKIQCYVRNRP
jgi:hypothetical protein